MYCDGVNWFFADHCFGDPDTPRLIPISDGIELIYIEANDWQPVRFSPFKEEVTFNQIDWWDANFKDQSEQFKGEYAKQWRLRWGWDVSIDGKINEID